MCQNRISPIAKIWYEFLPGLALVGLPRLASASLALPAPRNNSPAACGGRAARSAAAVVAGAGKASEADARRGEPRKPRPGEHADPHNDELRRTTTNYDELGQTPTNYPLFPPQVPFISFLFPLISPYFPLFTHFLIGSFMFFNCFN